MSEGHAPQVEELRFTISLRRRELSPTNHSGRPVSLSARHQRLLTNLAPTAGIRATALGHFFIGAPYVYGLALGLGRVSASGISEASEVSRAARGMLARTHQQLLSRSVASSRAV